MNITVTAERPVSTKVVATITTNADGVAETGLLPWGQYKITETGVLNGYLDAGYTTTVTIK